jgi:peptide/nickel transport system permease protein
LKTTHNSLTALALQKFKKNKTGVLSFWFVMLCGFIAIFAYVLAPDNSSNANQMNLEIHSKKPGFEVLTLTLPSEKKQSQSFFNKIIFGDKNKPTEIPIANYSIVNEELIVNSYTDNKVGSITKTYPLAIFKGKDISNYINLKTYYLGTDKYGRDLLSRMLIGTRISFFIGFIAVFISLIIGITVGAIAGFFGWKS